MRYLIENPKARFWPAALVGVMIALPTGVQGQNAVPATPTRTVPTTYTLPSTPSQEIAALAEEIAVLRAVKTIQMTPEQLTQLSAAVAAAQERLVRQNEIDLRSLAALRGPVFQARQQLLPAGVNLDDPRLAPALLTEQQVTAAQRTAAQNQLRLRDELTTTLRRQLQNLLTPAQSASLVAQGRALVVAERAEQDRQRDLRMRQMQQAMATRGANPQMQMARGGPMGNDGEREQRMLDRLREADADQYQRMSRGMARRFGDEGTPAYDKAVSLFDRVRNMPDRQFRRQRTDLTQQLRAGISASRSTPDPTATISAENGLDTWIRRYLLSPQAPAALKGLSTAKAEP